jgi:hypothetical protein
MIWGLYNQKFYKSKKLFWNPHQTFYQTKRTLKIEIKNLIQNQELNNMVWD